MNSIETIRAFFGWCTVINIGLMAFTAILLIAFRGPFSRIHAKMFNLNEKDISKAYFQYLSHYKIAIIILNIVPYFALRIIN